MTVGSANQAALSNSGSRRSPTTSPPSPTRASHPSSSTSSWPHSNRSASCSSRPRTGRRSVRSGEHHSGNPVGDEGGLVLAFNLDGEGVRHVDGVALELDVLVDALGPNARLHLHRIDETDLVEAV